MTIQKFSVEGLKKISVAEWRRRMPVFSQVLVTYVNNGPLVVRGNTGNTTFPVPSPEVREVAFWTGQRLSTRKANGNLVTLDLKGLIVHESPEGFAVTKDNEDEPFALYKVIEGEQQ